MSARRPPWPTAYLRLEIPIFIFADLAYIRERYDTCKQGNAGAGDFAHLRRLADSWSCGSSTHLFSVRCRFADRHGSPARPFGGSRGSELARLSRFRAFHTGGSCRENLSDNLPRRFEGVGHSRLGGKERATAL